MTTRFVVEGTWSGYTSAQSRVVHRTVHAKTFKRLRAWAEKYGRIDYTDGTRLHVTVRDAKPREKVAQIHGYDSLIGDCVFYDVTSVSEIQVARAALRLTPPTAAPQEHP